MQFDFAPSFLNFTSRLPGNIPWGGRIPSDDRIALFTIVVGLCCVTFVPSIRAVEVVKESYELAAVLPAGRHQQIKAVVEIAGELKLNADGKQVRRLPLEVQAELHFSERRLEPSGAAKLRVVRQYHTADAIIQIKGSETKQTLRPERRLILAQTAGETTTFFSPLGPITQEELDLIDVPGCRITGEELLPGKAVQLADRWKLSEACVTRLVNLDSVTQQDVYCQLDEVKDGVAIISASGKIAGAVGGISSDIELQGKLNFDLKRRCVTWLALSLKEDRAIGHAQPGYETTTRVRLIAAPLAAAPELTDKQLAALPLVVSPSATLLELNSPKGGYELLHDRRWHVMLDRYDVAVMRLVDQGDLVAQCNLSKLPPLGKMQQLTLDGFQQDVKKSLGKNFGRLVEAGEDKNDQGIRILRVTVSGFAAELPIQWTYYHLSDDGGHRASLVFTLESKLVERYAALDRELISGFRFLATPAESAAEPTPAAAETSARRKSATPL